MTKFPIGPNEANNTIYRFLRKAFQTTPLVIIEKWFRHKKIMLNGKKISSKKIVLVDGDEVVVYDHNQPQPRDHFKIINNPPLNIVYEDKNLLIVNKPSNLEIHSPINNSLDDLVKSYLVEKGEYQPQKEIAFVVSHLYRLDKLTSGLVIYAKNKPALDALQSAQSNHFIHKYYVARTQKWTQNFIADGWYYYDSVKKRAFFYRNQIKNPNLKNAKTEFKLLGQQAKDYYVQAKLITGRKHQIRATLSAFKMPIVNDFRYDGIKLNNKKQIYLKAFKLKFDQLDAPIKYLSNKTFDIDWSDLKS